MDSKGEKKQSRLSQGGFTLVELIVVLVIMGILTAAIVPIVTSYVGTAKEKVAQSNIRMVENGARMYITEMELNGQSIDGTVLSAQELVELGYLSPLNENENYRITFTWQKNGRQYGVQVTPMVENQPS